MSKTALTANFEDLRNMNNTFRLREVLKLPSVVRRESAPIDVLRLVLCAIIFTHGSHRLMEGSIPILGQILGQIGFPAGLVLAHLVNLAETGGTVLLALRMGVVPVCSVLCLIYATGIALFHGRAGFFVVGPGHDGWEYSALLIACFAVVAWDHRRRAVS
jgi:putative oxidoreductase